MDLDVKRVVKTSTSTSGPTLGVSVVASEGDGSRKVREGTDDVVVSHDVVQAVSVLHAVVLVHPVGVLQHHRLQADIISMWNAQLDTWHREV